MTLKQFKGPKPLAVIQQQCNEQGIILRRNAHDSFMSDFVVVSWPERPEVSVYFNVVSGWCFGMNEAGEAFDSRHPEYTEAWFTAVEEFFLVPMDQLDEVAV